MSEPVSTVCAMTGGGDGLSGGQPHDALFRSVFGDPEHAGSELRSVVPPELIGHLDLDRLVRQDGTFIDDALRHRHTDVLFATTVRGRDAYLYVLLEHQSTPDPLMAFRMAGYQHRIWERHLDMYPPEAGHRPLPLIIPIVIYQGRRRWTAPTDLAGLLDVDPELSVAAGDLIPRVFYLLDDLTVIDEHEMRARPLSTAARLTFVSFENAPGDRDATRWMGEWADDLAALDQRWLVPIFTYILRVSVTLVDRLVDFATTLGPDVKEAAMTTAEQLIAEGESRGAARGEARVLINMLTLKFGELDDDTKNLVRGATADQIDLWSARFVAGAADIDAVFDR